MDGETAAESPAATSRALRRGVYADLGPTEIATGTDRSEASVRCSDDGEETLVADGRAEATR